MNIQKRTSWLVCLVVFFPISAISHSETRFHGLFIVVGQPLHLLLIDSAGRRCGHNPNGEPYSEIPRCAYDSNSPGGFSRSLDVFEPEEGKYRLEASGHSSQQTLHFNAHNQETEFSKHIKKRIPTCQSDQAVYIFDYSAESLGRIKLRGSCTK